MKRASRTPALHLVRLLLLESICRRFASSSSTFISHRHPDGSHYRAPPSGSSARSSSAHSSWLLGSSALRERHSISTPAKPAVPHLSDWFSGSLALEQIQFSVHASSTQNAQPTHIFPISPKKSESGNTKLPAAQDTAVCDLQRPINAL